MIKIPFEIFSQSRTHPMKIIVGLILASLGSNLIRFGNLSLQDKMVLERIRFLRTAIPSV